MRTRNLIPALCLALLAPACGGGTGDDGPGAPLTAAQELQACLGEGLTTYLASFGGLTALLTVASDPAAAAALGATWTEVSATVYDFSLPVDLDGDGAPDATIDGTATFSADPDGGLSLGDEVNLEWDLVGHPELDGDGDISVRLGLTGLEVWGATNFADPDRCAFTFGAAFLEPLLVRIPGVWPPAPAVLLDSEPPVEIGGRGSVTVWSGEDALSADLLFSDSSNDVAVSDATITVDGVVQSLPDVVIALGPSGSPLGLQDWVGTWDIVYECETIIQTTFQGNERFVVTIRNGAPHVEVEDFTEQITFSFDVDLDANSTTSGTFRFVAGSGPDRFEERGTIRLIFEAGQLRIRKDSEYGAVGFLGGEQDGTCFLTSTIRQE